MEAGRSLLSPPTHLPRTHLGNSLFSSSSVPMLHDQASWAVTSIVRHYPASVLLQEQCDDLKHSHIIKEDKMGQAIVDRRNIESGAPICREKKNQEFNQCLKYFEHRLLYYPGFWYQLPPSYTKEKHFLSMSMESILNDTDVVADIRQGPVKPCDALALAKKAMIASQEAAALAENSYFVAAGLDESHFPGLGLKESTVDTLVMEEATVRSKRHLERQSKKRRLPKKPNSVLYEVSSLTDINKKISKGLDSNDPLKLFLWGPETKRLLTVKEEKDLFVQIQDLMRLEEVKQRLKIQFDREPTFVEWAEAVGMSCQVLQSCLYSGNRSREKMIYANFRLVVHVAKQYQGKGLTIQDLLQEGSMGLMKSLEKFKPKAGCRFPTYAYWWIRQSIRKAIFQNSRTIRLPENVIALLKKIRNARTLYIQEGHVPTNGDLAKRVGITVEKLERLLSSSRTPVSIQEHAGIDWDVTVQEITADPKIEIPDLSVSKQMMRQHVRNLLSFLPTRERQIIQFRYGIHDGEQKSLSDIGVIFGLSKERVRQLESRAMDRLKKCLSSHGLEAYVDLLV